MDNEYDLLKKNNEKYLIKIDEYKARLRAIQKQCTDETIAVNIYFLNTHIVQSDHRNFMKSNKIS
jgi:hypothetical protein